MKRLDNSVSRFAGLASLTALLLAMPSAWGSSFSVNPVRLTISRADPTATLHVRNQSTTPTVVQLSLKAWAQQSGKNIYTKTRQLIATPPIFTIPPGHEQIVRVGLRGKLQGTHQVAYRLFLTEVPPPPKAGFRGLRFALRIGLPVFVNPPVKVVPHLRWSGIVSKKGNLVLRVKNSGNAHIEVTHLKIVMPNKAKPLYDKAAIGYLLPGSEKELDIKAGALSQGTELAITAKTDSGEVHASVPVSR